MSPENLRGSYPYKVLELHADNKAIKKYLSDCKLIDINAFGDKYHLIVEHPAAAMREVASRLKAAGISVLSLKQIAPTLEDVFVALAKED
jgi:ABC-2 type transport system ATP-binding protein